jgi:hypothetical protein
MIYINETFHNDFVRIFEKKERLPPLDNEKIECADVVILDSAPSSISSILDLEYRNFTLESRIPIGYDSEIIHILIEDGLHERFNVTISPVFESVNPIRFPLYS